MFIVTNALYLDTINSDLKDTVRVRVVLYSKATTLTLTVSIRSELIVSRRPPDSPMWSFKSMIA